MTTLSGPMQPGLPIVWQLRVDADALSQQEIHHAGASELAGPRESILHLLRSGRGNQVSIRGEGTPDHVQPAHSRRRLQVQARAAVREKLRCLSAAIVQTSIDRAAAI